MAMIVLFVSLGIISLSARYCRDFSKKQEQPENRHETIDDNDHLVILKKEKGKSSMSVEEYEAFLQQQKELLKTVHKQMLNAKNSNSETHSS